MHVTCDHHESRTTLDGSVSNPSDSCFYSVKVRLQSSAHLFVQRISEVFSSKTGLVSQFLLNSTKTNDHFYVKENES